MPRTSDELRHRPSFRKLHVATTAAGGEEMEVEDTVNLAEITDPEQKAAAEAKLKQERLQKAKITDCPMFF